MAIRRVISLWAALALSALPGRGASWISDRPQPGGFALAGSGRAAAIITAPEDFHVVGIAAHDLAADIERVTGIRPAEAHTAPAGPAVLVGTLGHSPLIDGLVAAGKLDVTGLPGAWESFVITTVADPLPGVPSALVIAGSDRRGTAFGVYEVSQAIGVSPWYWWADVAPTKKPALFVAAGTRRFGPPSVKYRGIFLNDEDWGLQPWAAKTFEPEAGNIGPRTYAKICELLLRLKANTLWPAMHACTPAFNLNPQNKLTADDYAIVMGSSHAEPMLRDNVTEWTAPHADYNYVTNRAGVLAYWEQRVRENGRFENIYTLGMRGIHDSAMVGPKTDAQRIAVLEQIFADQRGLLTKYVNPRIESVPQIFCAYKEVLDLYRQGLKVPDDVTIVWPDDNFGYVRDFASAEEQKRRGGFGIYYHISYLGAPLSYLWLETTPPALIWEEMHKAYDHGAKKIWILNVGDLKPGEIGTEFFLQMAWDINRWNRDNLPDFLREWAAREFGPAAAAETAAVMAEYYRLNFARRPEQLQWWRPGQAPHASPLTTAESDHRLARFADLRRRMEAVAAGLPAAKRAAFEELVGYPVRGSALANERYFLGEKGRMKEALAANAELIETTRRFNDDLEGGKWRGIMKLEPADGQWRSMRIARWMPRALPAGPAAAPDGLMFPADQFIARPGRNGAVWGNIPDLGEAIFPTTAPSLAVAQLSADAPRLSQSVDFPAAGDFVLNFRLLPTHPLVAGRGLRFAVGLDDGPPQLVVCDVPDGSPGWAQGVLNNYVTVSSRLTVPSAGRHWLRLYGVDAGVVLESVVLRRP